MATVISHLSSKMVFFFWLLIDFFLIFSGFEANAIFPTFKWSQPHFCLSKVRILFLVGVYICSSTKSINQESVQCTSTTKYRVKCLFS